MVRRDIKVSDWLEIKYNSITYYVGVQSLLDAYIGARKAAALLGGRKPDSLGERYGPPNEQVAGKTVRNTERSKQTGEKD